MSWKNISTSPFFHFILLGAGIFLLFGFLNRGSNHPEGYDIQISTERLQLIAQNYQRNFGNEADEKTMEQLIDNEIKEEIYYREALRMGLNQDDEIIRRRLKQKYEFLINDQLTDQEPKKSDLLTYFNSHRDDYLTQATFSFEHIYFNPDRRKEPEKFAQTHLSNPDIKGDVFHISSPIMDQNLDELRNAFGYTFSQAIQRMESNETKVVESGFGHHVVKMKSIWPAQQLTFEEVEAEVKRDFLGNVRSERNKASYKELKKMYNIEIKSLP